VTIFTVAILLRAFCAESSVYVDPFDGETVHLVCDGVDVALSEDP
jgi:hypothetical protein